MNDGLCVVKGCTSTPDIGRLCHKHYDAVYEWRLDMVRALCDAADSAGVPLPKTLRQALRASTYLRQLQKGAGRALAATGALPPVAWPPLPRIWPDTGAVSAERWSEWVAQAEATGRFQFTDLVRTPIGLHILAQPKDVLGRVLDALQRIEEKIDSLLT